VSTCGHQLPRERLPPDITQITCDREPWKEASDDRCVLHTADRVEPITKVTDALSDADRVHGLQIARQSFPDGFELSGVQLYDADLQNADLSNCTFQNVEITESRFEGANLTNALFLYSEKDGENDDGGDEDGVVRTRNDMKSNNFSGAELTNTTFREIDLMGSVLECDNMKSVEFLDCSLSELDFYDETLRDSDFSYSILHETTFEECDLHNSTFHGSLLDSTKFLQANLRTADLRNAILKTPEFDSVRVNHQTQFDTILVQEYLADRYCEGSLSADVARDCKEFLHNRRGDVPIEFTDFGSSEGRIDGVWKSLLRLFAQRPGTDDGPDVGHLVHARYRYRDLSRVFGENEEPERAREYAIREKDCKRKNALRKDDSSRIWLSMARWMMTYGERPTQPLRVAFAVIVFSAVLYPVWGVRGSGSNQVISYCWSCDPGFYQNLERAISVGELSIVRLLTPANPGAVQPVGFGVVVGLLESILGALLLAMFVFTLGRRATE